MIPGLVRYLEEISVHLRLNPLREKQLLRELYTHLEDRVEEFEEEGRPHETAVTEATRTFGSPRLVAHEMYQVHGLGTWVSAAIASVPYIAVAFLFALHLWTSLAWLAAFMTVSVLVTLLGWWKGKPPWMYPWAGFSLVLPVASGFIAAGAFWRDATALAAGESAALPLWALAGLLVYAALALQLVVSVLVKVVRMDWTYASLMLLPIPIVVRWLLSLQMEGSVLAYERTSFQAGADGVVALVFLMLAALPMIFVRVSRRRFKIAALMIAAPVAFIAAAQNISGAMSLPALFLSTALAILLLLVPAFLDSRVGRGSPNYRAVASRETQNALSGLF